jgi:hypothetical protein
MIWIAIRMLTGDAQKFYGLVFGIAFSTLLITQQLTIFVSLLERGASAVFNVPAADIWVMDRVSRTTDVSYPMPSTALDKVRSVPGVKWAAPHLRANASVRTGDGDLEGVTIVGVDDATLIGLPRRMAEGSIDVLSRPDTVIIDDVGTTNMFADGRSPIGERLELNDQRAVIRGIADAIPGFTSQVTLYTKYSQALRYVPGTRNRLSFVLVGAAPGVDHQQLVDADRGRNRPARAHPRPVRAGRHRLHRRKYRHPAQFRDYRRAGFRRRRGDRRADLQPVHPRQYQAVRRAQGDRGRQRHDPPHGRGAGGAGRPDRLWPRRPRHDRAFHLELL